MKKLIVWFILLLSNFLLLVNISPANADSWDLTSPWFTIDLRTLFPSIVQKDSTEDIANFLLGTIIQTMMKALWVIAVFVMTIWAWYMILHSWDDSLLSKWKEIFLWWVYAMVVALASYYLVALVRYLLYNIAN